MSTITPHYRSVQQLLQSRSFSIDEYQREYKWEKSNVDELLTDLQLKFQSCYRPGDDTRMVSNYDEYFLGSIIVSSRNGRSYLIDGQQRVTSLSLLLICLYRAAKEQGLQVLQTIAPLIFSDNFGEPKFNLDIAERLPVIEALFKGDPFNPDGKDESIQTMHARYRDIEQNDLIADLGESLPHFAYWLMTRVGLIEIATDNDNYAYAIFETMNDRGKPLSPVDMLKAYLLAPILDEDKRRNANQVWKKNVLELITWRGEHEAERDAACIKAWFRAQYAESIRDRKAGSTDKDWELIGSTFHRWVRDNHQRLKVGGDNDNLALITDKFPFFSKAYRIVLDASLKYTPGLEAVFYNAHNEFTWQSTVLLAPLVVTDDDEVVRKKLAVTATYLDIWLMRQTVNYIRVGYSSTSYAMYLLCNDIRGKSLPELVSILTNKLTQSDITFEGSASKGRTGINGLSLNQFSRRYIYHLLARITSFVEVGSGKPDLFDKYVDRSSPNPCDIEHIWANDFDQYRTECASQQEFDELRNRVGGLLLLPADVNRSYQDKSFKDKSPHYAKQNLYAASLTGSTYEHQPQFDNFRTTRGLPFRPYEKFGKAEQLERTLLIKQMANQIWSHERLKDYLV
jgi:uncharacterized protein with ParB-like and HNH nuclease domain